jgi:hypothetical protein
LPKKIVVLNNEQQVNALQPDFISWHNIDLRGAVAHYTVNIKATGLLLQAMQSIICAVKYLWAFCLKLLYIAVLNPWQYVNDNKQRK